MKSSLEIAQEAVLRPIMDVAREMGIEEDEVDLYGKYKAKISLDVIDRLIVDSTEWPDLAASYERLTGLFDRVVVSDIAWSRTSRWRLQLASLWPGIAHVQKIRVVGTAAQAHLLAGWLRSRLKREVVLEHDQADRLEGVDIDGEPAPFPPGDPPAGSDLLSEELDKFGRDRIYEDAVRNAGGETN